MPGRSFAVPTRGTMRGMQQQRVKACEIMHGITYWCIYSLDENTPIDCSFSFQHETFPSCELELFGTL